MTDSIPHHASTLNLGSGLGDMRLVVRRAGDPVEITFPALQSTVPSSLALKMSREIARAAKASMARTEK